MPALIGNTAYLRYKSCHRLLMHIKTAERYTLA